MNIRVALYHKSLISQNGTRAAYSRVAAHPGRESECGMTVSRRIKARHPDSAGSGDRIREDHARERPRGAEAQGRGGSGSHHR